MVEDGDEVTNLLVQGNTEYAFNRFFSGIVTAGYEKLDAGSRADSSDSLIWTVGGRFLPGPRTALRVEYGRRYDGSYYDGDFSYQISPTMGISASYRQDVSIQQTTVNNALATLGTDDLGNFIDTVTGLPFSATGADADLSEVDNVNRTRSFNISLSGTRGRNSYGTSISWNNSKTRAQSRSQTSRSASLTFSRQLSPRADLGLSAAVTDSSDNTAADTTTKSLSTTFGYRIGNNVNGSAVMSHLRRDSRVAASDLEENTITARLQITF